MVRIHSPRPRFGRIPKRQTNKRAEAERPMRLPFIKKTKSLRADELKSSLRLNFCAAPSGNSDTETILKLVASSPAARKGEGAVHCTVTEPDRSHGSRSSSVGRPLRGVVANPPIAAFFELIIAPVGPTIKRLPVVNGRLPFHLEHGARLHGAA